VGGVCGTHGRGEKSVQSFGGKETTWKTKALMGGWDQDVSYGDWLRSVEWIQLAQDRDRWRVLVNTVMNLRVLDPRNWLCTYLSPCGIESVNILF
jgi:hypothetical protein